MNNHYLIIVGGWLVGQFVYAACSIYSLQNKRDITYWKAAQLYLSSEIGSFILAFSGLLVLLFIANDFVDVKITRADLLNKAALTWKEKLIVYQHCSAFVLGMLSQHLIYAVFKKGKKKIEEYEIENSIQDKKP